ncbi:MAG: hypothetical protein KBS81_10205 [Spirochaetales bacterium]|nr:hypothetical protein [Candidatus Physcosoma equi]
MENTKKLMRVMLIALLVFFAGMFLAHQIATDNGNVELRRLSVMTDRGVAISLEVFKPKTATKANPAPAVMLIPGGNAAVENMSDSAMELARRGIVAIGIEPYTIGRSDVEKDNSGLGSIDVVDYITHLDFIDQEKLGFIGWSMGTSRANAALYIDDPSGEMVTTKNMFGQEVTSVKQIIRPGFVGVMYVGAGGLLDTSYKINSALFEGEWDNLYRGDRRVMNSNPQYVNPIKEYLGGADHFDFRKWYGDPQNGTGRIYYEGFTGHVIGLASPSYVKAACDFWTTTFGIPNTKPILYMWKEVGTAVSFCASIVFLISMVFLLLSCDWFKKDLVTDASKRRILEGNPKDWTVWVGIVIPAICGAALAKWAVPKGQGIMNKWVTADLIHGTNIQNVNGLVFWLVILEACGIACWLIINFLIKMKSTDKKALLDQVTLPGTRFVPMFLKALLLAFMALMSLYFMITFCEQMFSMSPRFWQVQVNSLVPLRMGKFLLYFPMYMIPFLFANYMHSTSCYLEKKPVLSTVLFWLANGLPPMLFLCYAYGKIAFMHTTPITSLGMSRANGGLVNAAIMMVPVGIFASTLYRKTKNFYLPAIFNSMYFTWLAISTDLIFIGA